MNQAHIFMCTLCIGPAAKNLRVAAIISITLEYKMRVINFITNYVGPAGAHLKLPRSQSQRDVRVGVTVRVAVNIAIAVFIFF